MFTVVDLNSLVFVSRVIETRVARCGVFKRVTTRIITQDVMTVIVHDTFDGWIYGDTPVRRNLSRKVVYKVFA